MRKSIWVLYILFLAMLPGTVLAVITASDLSIVGERKVSRTQYEYTYRLNAANSELSSYSSVYATINSKSTATSIIKNNVSFDVIPANGKAQSKDTFTISHNRQVPFDFKSLDFTFSVRNTAPTANAGLDQSVQNGNTVTLNGNSSNDPDSDTLTYSWSLVSVPSGSSAILSDRTVITPTFTPDKAGIYIAELIVTDGTLGSVQDTVRIKVTDLPITLSDDIKKAFGANPKLNDTDGDGLPDSFEILKTTPHLMPNSSDTDKDGITDDKEDTDNDGLLALEEFKLGTDPLSKDTDGDGLFDKTETTIYLTNPLDPDTDKDGLTDGQEIRANTKPTVADTDKDGVLDSVDSISTSINTSGASLSLTGQGYFGNTISISSKIKTTNTIGQVSSIFKVDLDKKTTGRLKSASITLPYDAKDPKLGKPSDLQIFTYDENLKLWVPASTSQTVDTVNHTVKTTVPHFSQFAVFNPYTWQQSFTQKTSSCSTRNNTMDVVLVLDSSGSMTSNDPSNLRLSAAKSFVNSLSNGGKAAVVDFDNTARIYQSLTDSKNDLTVAIERVDSSGGTNIGAGVSSALSILKEGSSANRRKAIVLLTDGDGDYNNDLTQQASAQKISIFTVGLGSGTNSTLLQGIADGTNGKFVSVANADTLISVFNSVQIDAGSGKDTDGDGLTDTEETTGFYDFRGNRYFSDPTLEDSDGDNLTDLEETGYPLSATQLLDPATHSIDLSKFCYFSPTSNPQKADSDSDGLDDPTEVDNESNALLNDTDFDGSSDFIEASWETDPNSSDTDKDTFSDTFEIANINDGYHPLAFTTVKSKSSYLGEFTVGGLCGEICNLTTIAHLTGNISFSLVPVAGTFRDIIDAAALAIKGEFVSSGLTLVGVIPVAGDTVEVVSKTVKFAGKNLDKVDEVIQLISKADWAPNTLKKEVLTKVGKEAVSTLVNKGFTDDTLLRLANAKVGSFSALAKAISRANATVIKGSSFFTDWRDAEKVLRNGTTRPKLYPPIPPSPRDRTILRYFDALINDVAKEAKTGYVHYDNRIIEQIRKDVALMSEGHINKSEWHFFPSGKSNSIGADSRILDELDAVGIKYFFHIP